MNPVGGTAWVVSEDLYVCGEKLPYPSRAWVNLLRFKRPWFRENWDIYGCPQPSASAGK